MGDGTNPELDAYREWVAEGGNMPQDDEPPLEPDDDEPRAISEPGIYELSNADYQADPALSSTGARRLLPPSCPAKFHYLRTHAEQTSEAFDVGHAAHAQVLGNGPEIVVVDARDWRTKAAKEAAANARARGAVPLLAEQWARVIEMRDALFAHPFAGKLFEPGSGEAETSLFWRDDPTGIMRRARLDWLRAPGSGRLIVPDLKTADSADPDDFARQAARYGYHQQGAWYLDGVRARGLADDAVFVFVVQEKTPPYVVSVVQLDAPAMRIGATLNRRAIELYVQCSERDEWPGYVDDVALASLPRWYEIEHEEDTAA